MVKRRKLNKVRGGSMSIKKREYSQLPFEVDLCDLSKAEDGDKKLERIECNLVNLAKILNAHHDSSKDLLAKADKSLLVTA